MGERGGGNPKVVCADRFTSLGETGPDVCMHPGNGLRDRNCLELREQIFNERPSTGSPSSGCSQGATKQFAHRDHADGALFVSQTLFNLGSADATLEIDQHVCVN